MKKYWPLIIALAVCAFFATYKLTESPPTWMDEGLIIQPAKNLALEGVYKVQVAPGQFISPSYISTSYPVTAPIALAFKLFGVGLLQARSVMAVYLLLFVALAYIFCRREIGETSYLWPILLLVSFAPLYGQGKNVLGEVPGMFFLLLTFYLLSLVEDPNRSASRKTTLFVLASLVAGLCVATKPIFVLILPAIFVWFLGARKSSRLSLGDYLAGALFFAMPLVLWLKLQFSGDSFAAIIHFYIYANPGTVDVATLIKSQVVSFFTEAQPAYFLALTLVWVASIVSRVRSRVKLANTEWAAITFVLLILLAYLRTRPYYRYFFTAELLCLAYLPASLKALFPRLWSRKLLPVALCVLILAQFYLLSFRSWVADSYTGTKTADIVSALRELPADGSFYIYGAPELVTFMPTKDYYQYTSGLPTSESSLQYLASTTYKIPYVLTKADFTSLPIFSKYTTQRTFQAYALMKYNDNQ